MFGKLVVGVSSLGVGSPVLRISFDSLGEVEDGLMVLSEFGVADGSIFIGLSFLGVKFDGSSVVIDGFLVLLLLSEQIAPVEEGLRVVRVQHD